MSEALFSMVAGSDTTASAIRATMLYLITTPRVYRKLKQVVTEAVQSGRVSSPIKQEEAKEISYLQVGNPNLQLLTRWREQARKLIFARLSYTKACACGHQYP